MTEGTFTTGDGCAIAWRLDGLDGAPILALSNSLGTAMAMWEPQMATLTASRRILRYDSRGHGASDAPAGGYSIDRLGRDVVELLDALAIDTIDFCGLSKGGMIGQWLGWRAPDRLRKLILANTSAYMGPPESWDARIRLVIDAGMAAMVEPVIERWFRPGFVEAAPNKIAAIRSLLLATPAHGYAGCCAAIRDMDQRRLLGLIRAPTLVIAGTDDPATPLDHAETLARGIPGATLRTLPAAHLSNVEDGDAFTRLLLDHLA